MSVAFTDVYIESEYVSRGMHDDVWVKSADLRACRFHSECADSMVRADSSRIRFGFESGNRRVEKQGNALHPGRAMVNEKLTSRPQRA